MTYIMTRFNVQPKGKTRSRPSFPVPRHTPGLVQSSSQRTENHRRLHTLLQLCSIVRLDLGGGFQPWFEASTLSGWHVVLDQADGWGIPRVGSCTERLTRLCGGCFVLLHEICQHEEHGVVGEPQSAAPCLWSIPKACWRAVWPVIGCDMLIVWSHTDQYVYDVHLVLDCSS